MFFLFFHCELVEKRPQGKQMAPINNRGVSYQTDGKQINKMGR